MGKLKTYRKMTKLLEKGEIIVLTYQPKTNPLPVKENIAMRTIETSEGSKTRIVEGIIHMEEIAKLPENERVLPENQEERIEQLTRILAKVDPIVEKREAKAPHFRVEDMAADLISELKKIGTQKLKSRVPKLDEYIEILSEMKEPRIFMKETLGYWEDYQAPLKTFIRLLDILVQHKHQYPVLKVPKDLFPYRSFEWQELVQEWQGGNLIDYESQTPPPIEALKVVEWPSSWGCDEYMLLFDYFVREYRKKPRTKVLVIFGRDNVPKYWENKYIIVSVSRLMKTLDNISRDQAKRLLYNPSKDSRQLSTIQMLETSRIIIDAELKEQKKKIGFIFWIIRAAKSPGVKIGNLTAVPYELNEEVFKLHDEQKYTFIEANTFARIKKSLPSKTQSSAARVVVRAHAKAINGKAILSRKEMAELIGAKSQLKSRHYKRVDEKAANILNLLKDKAKVIKSWKWNGKTFEIMV